MFQPVCLSGDTTRMNLVQAINNTLDLTLATDPTAGDLQIYLVYHKAGFRGCFIFKKLAPFVQ